MTFAQDIGTSEKLYLLMAQRLKDTDERLPYTMDALRTYASEGRAEIDYLKLINLDNRSFFDAVYMIAFNTIPPAQYAAQWRTAIETLPKEKFQRNFINSFVERRDFATHYVRLRNCTCLNMPSQNMKGDRHSKTLKERIFQMLKPAYLKLPEPAREKLKALLWNYFFCSEGAGR